MSTQYPLNETLSPISREERMKMNENWQRIIAYFENLQLQIKVLSSGKDVKELLDRISALIEKGEAQTEEMEGLIVQANQLVVDADALVSRLNQNVTKSENLVSELETLKQTLTNLQTQLNQLKINLEALEKTVSTNETQRSANETQRTTNENTRKSNEATRVSDETTRKSNEVKREENETQRKANEVQRQTNETKRVSDFNAMQTDINNFATEGNFSLSVQYKKNNAVVYNGSSYIARKDTIGNLPPTLPLTFNEFWQLSAQRGIDGEGSVKSVNGISPDVNGNVPLEFNVTWSEIAGKPSTFTPSTHTHTIAQIDGLQTELNKKYVKPPTGITKTDLDTAVQTSLGKADTAIQTIPNATTAILGGVKVGTNVSVSSGTISVANASTTTKGVVQLNDTLTSTSTTLAATANQAKVLSDKIDVLSQKKATTQEIGLVKPDGTTITVDLDGTLHGANIYELPIASETVLGGIKPDGTTITVNPSTGIASAAGGGYELSDNEFAKKYSGSLNNLLESGFYSCDSKDTTDLPESGSSAGRPWMVIVNKDKSTSAAFQMATHVTSGSSLYFRSRGIANAWLPWNVIVMNVVISGSQAPNGVITAPVGTLYLSSSGGVTTTLYVKTSGTGNTGWTAK